MEVESYSLVRECCVCRALKLAESFVQGTQYCQGCRAEYRRRYLLTEQGRVTILARTARRNALKRGRLAARHDRSHEYSLTPAQLFGLLRAQDGLCAVTRQPLSLEPHLNTTISLDRLDDAQGYHAANCRLVCHAVNAARKFEAAEVLAFPLVRRHAVAREAAAVARDRARRRQQGHCQQGHCPPAWSS
jgi:hypothetical protein